MTVSSPEPRRAALPRYRYSRRRWWAVMGLIDLLGGWLAGLVGLFSRRAAPSIDVRRLLLIQLDHLGDSVLSLPLIGALRRRWPTARIDVLAAPWNREVFEQSGQIDRVWVSTDNRFDRRGSWTWPLSMIGWGWRLRRERYDLAIDLRGELPLALVMWLAGAKRRVGWRAGGGGFLLTDSADFDPELHTLEARERLLSVLGLEPLAGRERRPRWNVRDGERRSQRARGEAAGLEAGRYLVAHLGAGTSAKRWPDGHWRAWLERAAAAEFGPIVLVGGEDDRARAATLLAGREWPEIVDWTGRLSLAELAALSADCALFIGGDSGPAHVAAAVDAPSLILWSGTNLPRHWHPLGNRTTLLMHDTPCSPCRRQDCPVAGHPCLGELDPGWVWEQARSMLSQHDPSLRRRTTSPVDTLVAT